MESFFSDFRYGLRSIIKRPGFTAVAVITLALGIGANTAIFSVVNALLLRPLPFKEPEKLVQVWESNLKRGGNTITASYPNFADWRDQNQVFELIAAYSDRTFNLTDKLEPERIQGEMVSPAIFPLLGVKPILGRTLLPEEDYPNKVFSVVISERLWRRRFNSNQQIIGQRITLDSESFTVVGVVPNITDLFDVQTDTEVWVPISHSFGFDNRYGHYLDVVARLKPGVTREQAQASMNRIASSLAAQYPSSNSDQAVRLVPLQQQIVGDFKLAVLVLLGAVLFVLLIASANVANMLLARAVSRKKEIAIRTALGAGRRRLVRQLLTESLLLSALGGGVGLLLALWGIYLLLAFGPGDLPRVKEVSVDGRVLGFTFAVSVLTGIIFGFVPALQASRPELNETLKESGRSAMGSAGNRRVRSLLVTAEVALSLVLLAGAGLLMRSFLKLQAVTPGFNPNNVLTMKFSLRGPNYQKAGPIIAFHDQLIEKIKALPGVQSVATRSYVPIAPDDGYANLSFAIDGRLPDRANRPTAFYNAVSPDYFQTMEIPVLEGRPFEARDDRRAQSVIIINATLARRYFSGEDAIGRRMTLNDDNPKEEDWATIVGVVGDTKPRAIDLTDGPVAEMYMPFAQQPEPGAALMIRTTNKPESVAAAVSREVQALDKNQLTHSVRTLGSVMSEAVATPRFRTSLLGVFAAVALILAMVGIYGVMSYAVTQRTHEIGIRIALGARTTDVLKLIVQNGMWPAFLGVALGLAGAIGLTRLMASFLFGVRPTDALTLAAVSIGLILAALIACFIPAQRAAKVDPLEALRYE
jgi:putative ABC transport system permease protein